MSSRRSLAGTLAAAAALCAMPAHAAGQWFLMARHGECFEVATLKRKVPDLGDIRDPDRFVAFMRQKGYDVYSTPAALSKGEAREVRVPALELALLFVTREVCSAAAAR